MFSRTLSHLLSRSSEKRWKAVNHSFRPTCCNHCMALRAHRKCAELLGQCPLKIVQQARCKDIPDGAPSAGCGGTCPTRKPRSHSLSSLKPGNLLLFMAIVRPDWWEFRVRWDWCAGPGMHGAEHRTGLQGSTPQHSLPVSTQVLSARALLFEVVGCTFPQPVCLSLAHGGDPGSQSPCI